ncbi:MAG: ATPase [Parvibaculum sp.]|nr:ATPase [Parvibaculum sp.]
MSGEEETAAIFDLARNRTLDEQPPHPGRDGPRLPKRFYKEAQAGEVEGGYAILLDGRAVKTPSKQVLAVPYAALARAMAAEWAGQGEYIDPRSMWLTKLANTALDLVKPRRAAVIAEIVNFAGTDLLCYRAEAPDALVARQAAEWEPLLAWAAKAHGIRLKVTTGIVHVAQDDAALAAYGRALEGLDHFRLAALHNAVTLTGSAVIGLALLERRLDVAGAFAAAHLDETWQMEISGRDAEEEARLARRRAELGETSRFLDLLSDVT